MDSVFFFLEMYSAKVQQVQEDKMVWSSSRNQGFRVSNYYKVLRKGVINFFLGEPFGMLELHLMLLSSFGLQ